MEGRYTPSILAKITGLPAHYLRRLEKAGLLSPCRSRGGRRLYTQRDLEILKDVKQLKEKGINLPGITEILKNIDR
ncbi:MAG: MerR family transcriptional regulator [Dehalococcoidales bacterium]|jgi:MerR family glutamine synthetase transcriptional repressor|nr:MerR family transcriptional regulator [Dehalococcoidales bacterium]MDX9803205.1 MerR family transcriptional regulator [Dehalococcoidales bacterium]